jgi:hypothetical protein
MQQDFIINLEVKDPPSSGGIRRLLAESIVNLQSSVICPRTSTSVENPLQISYFLCKTNPISERPK